MRATCCDETASVVCGDCPRKPAADAKRLLEIADELEEMARGYLEKGAQLHAEAAHNRAVAAALTK